MMYLNCLLVVVAFVIVSDKLHWWENFSPIISGWMTRGKIRKPIPSKLMTCSTCQSWWANLIYLIIINKLSIVNVVYVLFLAYMAPVVSDLLELANDIFKRIFEKLQ